MVSLSRLARRLGPLGSLWQCHCLACVVTVFVCVHSCRVQSNQLEEADALDEEKEAIRLQKKQVEKLSEEDFLFGGPSLADVVAGGKKSAPRGASAPAVVDDAQPVERVQRKTDRMSKADMLQIVMTGA